MNAGAVALPVKSMNKSLRGTEPAVYIFSKASAGPFSTNILLRKMATHRRQSTSFGRDRRFSTSKQESGTLFQPLHPATGAAWVGTQTRSCAAPGAARFPHSCIFLLPRRV